MEPSTLSSTKCQNCGAEMEESLDGTFTCTHCGSVFRNNHPNNTMLADTGDKTSTGLTDNPIPQEIAPGYNKKKRWHPLVTGAIIWVAYGLFRMVLVTLMVQDSPFMAGIIQKSYIFSPPVTLFWILRTLLFLGVIPGLIYLRRRSKAQTR